MKKAAGAGIVVLALVGAILALTLHGKLNPPPPPYAFLGGAASSEQITKDPRFGGGQRIVYHLNGKSEDIQKAVEAELGSKPFMETDEYAIYKDSDRTIYVGQGRAKTWKEVMAIASTMGSDQFSQELMQRQFFLDPDSSSVAIAIDKPILRAAEKAINRISRSTAPPPEQFASPDFSYTLTRKGKDVEILVSYENKGQLEEELLIVRKISMDGLEAEGLPHTIKPGGKGSFVVIFRNLGTGPKTLQLEYEHKKSGPAYGGKMYGGTQGNPIKVP